MRCLITLHLLPEENTFDYVKKLHGVKELNIDEEYGLVAISPKRNLYTIRSLGEVDREKLMSQQIKVKGVYGDVKVSSLQSNYQRR